MPQNMPYIVYWDTQLIADDPKEFFLGFESGFHNKMMWNDKRLTNVPRSLKGSGLPKAWNIKDPEFFMVSSSAFTGKIKFYYNNTNIFETDLIAAIEFESVIHTDWKLNEINECEPFYVELEGKFATGDKDDNRLVSYRMDNCVDAFYMSYTYQEILASPLLDRSAQQLCSTKTFLTTKTNLIVVGIEGQGDQVVF